MILLSANDNEVVYKRKIKRPPNFIYTVLSKKDEGVPDTHIPLYQIFVISPEIRNLYGENVANELRRNTYRNVLKEFEKLGATDFCDFWNAFKVEIAELKMIEFAKYEKLKPFCEYVECFKTEYMTQHKKPRHLIHFGISRKILNKYREEQLRAKKLGIEFVPPTLRKTNVTEKERALNGEYFWKHEKTKIARVPKNEVFYRFSHWCELQGVSKIEGCKMALEAVVLMNPVEGILPLSAYKQESVFDKLENTKREKTDFRVATAKINADVYNQASDIISAYNKDTDNKTKSNMNISKYINNALVHLNNKMPLQYRNPKLYEEQQKTKEYVEYVNSILVEDERKE